MAGGCGEQLQGRQVAERGGAGVPGQAPAAAVVGLPGAALPPGGGERRGPAPLHQALPRLPRRQEDGDALPCCPAFSIDEDPPRC